MKSRKKMLITLKGDIKHTNAFNDKLSIFISDLYSDRLLETERENKVLLEKLLKATQGKEIVLENNSKK